MEKWQKMHITSNFDKLIKVTFSNTNTLAFLKAKHILGDADLDAIESTTGRFAAAKLLYDIIQTKVGGYDALVRALYENGQTGAVDILLDGYPTDVFLNLNVSLSGTTRFLKELLLEHELQDVLSLVRSKLQPIDYYNVIKSQTIDGQIQNLVSGLIPPLISTRVPRVLKQVLQINPNIFKVECPDIFAFKMMPLATLTNLAKPYYADTFYSESKELAARFIRIENDGDWKTICSITQHPVHLIRFDDKQSAYILEDTYKESDVLSVFLPPTQLGTNFQNLHISEETLLQICDQQDEGFCVFGQQGCGKSVLMTWLAAALSERNPDNTIVAFIYLPHFSSQLSHPLPKVMGDSEVVKKLIVGHISPTPLTQAILLTLINRKETPTKMKIFIDGINEIQPSHQNWINDFIRASTRIPNITIFSTYESHGGKDDGSSVFSTAYGILPLSREDQINIMLKAWAQSNAKCDPEILRDFADHCLDHFLGNMSIHERNLCGTSLLCYLIGDYYKKSASMLSEARQYSSTSFTLPSPDQSSMFDLFKQFIDRRVGSDSDTANILFGDRSMVTDSGNMKRYHVQKALELLYPEIADVYGTSAKVHAICYDQVDQQEVLWKVPSNGLLFAHHLFAEYLVAELFANILIPDHPNPDEYLKLELPHNIINLFLERALSHKEYGIHNIQLHFQGIKQPVYELYSFDNAQFLYFLNGHLERRPEASAVNPLLINIFCKTISADQLHRIIMCTLSQNHSNIFRLIRRTLKAIDGDSQHSKCYRNYLLDKNRPHHLLLVAAEHSSVEMLKEYFQLFQETFNHDLKAICRATPANQLSPLHLALKQGNNDLVEYFLENVYLGSGRLYQILVCFTRLDSRELLEKKIKILRHLIKSNRNSFMHIFPLLGNLVHKNVIQCIFLEGCDINTKDYYGNTIAHLISKNIAADEYHDMVCFLLETCKAGNLFRSKNIHSSTPLHEACWNVNKLKPETVKMIAAVERLDINVVDEDGNNPLLTACASKGSMDLLKTLVELGARYNAKNNRGQNALHLAVEGANVEAVSFLKTLPDIHDHTDHEGKSCMDLALQKLQQFQTYPGVYSTAVESIKTIINTLK